MAAALPDCLRSQCDRNLVKDIIKSIMILDHSKKPFKYNEIMYSLNQKPTRKRLALLFNEARNHLKTLGLALHETKHTTVPMYFVTSLTQPLEIMYKHAPEEEVSDRILLTFVLAFIFMKNGAVYSDRLFNHLQRLGIYDESKPIHPYFGNVKKKIMTEFSEQLYLSIKKLAVEQEMYEVKWGQRAEIEISKRSILEFICNKAFGGKVKPHEHPSHVEQVRRQEQQRNATNDTNHEEETAAEAAAAAAVAAALEEVNAGSDYESDIQDMEIEGEENKNHGPVESL